MFAIRAATRSIVHVVVLRALGRIALPRRRVTLDHLASLPAQRLPAGSAHVRTLAMIRTASIAIALTASLARSQVTTYCTAGTTVQGCVPSISGIGIPSPYSTSGFEIVVDNVPTQRMGLIFYGLNSIPQPQPWAVGSASYLCIFYPVNRTGAHNSGGAIGLCDGDLRVDFNSWRAANPTALGSPFALGQVLYAQGWFRDPGAAKQTNLSDGLRFVLSDGPPRMVPIPAGTFQMGSDAPSGPPYLVTPDEQPSHLVTISYRYWMSETEVTQAQYVELMGTNPSQFPGASNPVELVSWIEAQAYCAALTAQQSALGNVPPGHEYRLPTEAEWEYACRAGTTTEFNVGADLFCSQAKFQYSLHSNSACFQWGGPGASTAPVKSHAPNVWGLYDMHGNVAEWCLDSFALYSPGAVTDPFISGNGQRVFRGGGWMTLSGYCRSAYRGYNSLPLMDVGFRVVLAPILGP